MTGRMMSRLIKFEKLFKHLSGLLVEAMKKRDLSITEASFIKYDSEVNFIMYLKIY